MDITCRAFGLVRRRIVIDHVLGENLAQCFQVARGDSFALSLQRGHILFLAHDVLSFELESENVRLAELGHQWMRRCNAREQNILDKR